MFQTCHPGWFLGNSTRLLSGVNFQPYQDGPPKTSYGVMYTYIYITAINGWKYMSLTAWGYFHPFWYKLTVLSGPLPKITGFSGAFPPWRSRWLWSCKGAGVYLWKVPLIRGWNQWLKGKMNPFWLIIFMFQRGRNHQLDGVYWGYNPSTIAFYRLPGTFKYFK